MTQRERIVKVAQGEIGYHEKGNNITKYGEWYGMQDEWCAIFVSWCAKEAGISSDIIPKMAYVPSIANWFDKQGLYYNSKHWGGDYVPEKGDLILFDWDANTNSDHIGIVEAVQDNIVITIEGNKSNEVKREYYTLNYSGIRAYCRPKYIEGNTETKPSEPYYQNGSTAENVYADTSLSLKIGLLNPYEKCKYIGKFENRAIVLYQVDGKVDYKIGFVEYLGGINNG